MTKKTTRKAKRKGKRAKQKKVIEAKGNQNENLVDSGLLDREQKYGLLDRDGEQKNDPDWLQRAIRGQTHFNELRGKKRFFEEFEKVIGLPWLQRSYNYISREKALEKIDEATLNTWTHFQLNSSLITKIEFISLYVLQCVPLNSPLRGIILDAYYSFLQLGGEAGCWFSLQQVLITRCKQNLVPFCDLFREPYTPFKTIYYTRFLSTWIYLSQNSLSLPSLSSQHDVRRLVTHWVTKALLYHIRSIRADLLPLAIHFHCPSHVPNFNILQSAGKEPINREKLTISWKFLSLLRALYNAAVPFALLLGFIYFRNQPEPFLFAMLYFLAFWALVNLSQNSWNWKSRFPFSHTTLVTISKDGQESSVNLFKLQQEHGGSHQKSLLTSHYFNLEGLQVGLLFLLFLLLIPAHLYITNSSFIDDFGYSLSFITNFSPYYFLVVCLLPPFYSAYKGLTTISTITQEDSPCRLLLNSRQNLRGWYRWRIMINDRLNLEIGSFTSLIVGLLSFAAVFLVDFYFFHQAKGQETPFFGHMFCINCAVVLCGLLALGFFYNYSWDEGLEEIKRSNLQLQGLTVGDFYLGKELNENILQELRETTKCFVDLHKEYPEGFSVFGLKLAFPLLASVITTVGYPVLSFAKENLHLIPFLKAFLA